MAGVLIGLMFIATAIDPNIFNSTGSLVCIGAAMMWCFFLDIMPAGKRRKG